MTFFKHRISFSDARGVPEVDFELPQAALFDEPQKIFRLQSFHCRQFHLPKKLFPWQLVEREVQTAALTICVT